MSSIANALTSPTTSTPSGTTPAAAQADPLASEGTFLTLLVSQLQNQDPLDPVDSNEFVTQLTQYSQLEQLIGIHSDTTSLSSSVSQTQTPAQSNAIPTTLPNSTDQTNTSMGVN